LKISAGKSYKRQHRALNALFATNPGLFLGFDLPFLIAASTSLKNAAAISAEIIGIHMVTMALSVIFARKLPLWLRSLVTTVISAAVMMGIREFLRWALPEAASSQAMYIYLLAVNGLTLFQSLSLGPRARLMPVLRAEAYHVFAFVAAMFTLSAAREYIGTGALWGVPLGSAYRLSGIQLPLAGFVLLGFLIAFMRFFNRRLMGFLIRENYRHQNRFSVRAINEQ
jgi:electron transport complex protein RnfE